MKTWDTFSYSDDYEPNIKPEWSKYQAETYAKRCVLSIALSLLIRNAIAYYIIHCHGSYPVGTSNFPDYSLKFSWLILKKTYFFLEAHFTYLQNQAKKMDPNRYIISLYLLSKWNNHVENSHAGITESDM